MTTDHLAPHFTQQAPLLRPVLTPTPVHLWPSPWPWSLLCGMRIPMEKSCWKAKERPLSERELGRLQRRWGPRSQTADWAPLRSASGPGLRTKCCSCATQWAQRELHAPASPAASRACGSSPRQLRTKPGDESMLVSGCSHSCARNEATFSKRRNQNGSNTHSADEDGNIYYFSGALNFPECPCAGPADCCDSL